MISLDAMMKFVAGPASDASTLSSGDQPSTSSSVSAGAAMVSSGVGKGGMSIKTEMGDHKKVSERKPTGEKKIFKKTKFVPPKSANKLPVNADVSNLPVSKTEDAEEILRDLAAFKSKHKSKKRKGHTDTKQPKPAPHMVTKKPKAPYKVDNKKTEDNIVKPESVKVGEFVQDALPSDTIANVISDKKDSERPAELNKETFECAQCGKKFLYMKRLNAHQLKGSCNQGVYECSQCKIKLKNARSLQRHVKNIHEKPRYQCVECSKLFPTNKTVQRHLKNHHALSLCNFCEKVFKNKNSLRVHVQSCRKKKATLSQEAATNATNQIDEETENNKKVKNNIVEEGENNNNQKMYYSRKCERCGKNFLSKGGYSKHMKNHRVADQNNTLKDVLTLKEGEVKMFVLKNNIENNIDIEFIDETEDSPIGNV